MEFTLMFLACSSCFLLGGFCGAVIVSMVAAGRVTELETMLKEAQRCTR